MLALVLAGVVVPGCARGSGKIIGWGAQVVGVDLSGPFVQVAGGGDHSLALKSDGSIVAWGHNYSGQCDVPAPNTGFVAVAAGWGHSLGLKSDGSIVAWGYNYSGQCDVPAPNTGFVAIAGGDFHSLGLKSDGSIVAWGWDDDGQCDVPAPNTGFVAVAASSSHSLGLKSDGSIVAWGGNPYGECDVPAPNTGFVAVAAGGAHSLAIQSIPRSVRLAVRPNAIRVQPNQMLTVAILSDENLDARDIDHTSVTFGPNQAACVRDKAHWEDIDGDGRVDLVLKFRCGDTGIQPGDTTVDLHGRLYNGDWIAGLAEIRTLVK